ncbi:MULTISPECIES: NAD-dependent epimerase/dehydratase family protein [unclassified Paenibacillus]|uniref:NAD-dependent epimerase/dehydratase family protein n=1 Tax=unclassified Paenibacillus TaxID=185978 RepID=UPI001915ACA5|nr:NAD-dependent epimerase/dehydratase family protein [Paenibacillus sp. EPM92]
MKLGKVLVTGGAGFLGSQLVKRLLPRSEHIYVIDDLSTGNPRALPDSDQITFIQGSITNEELLEEIMPKVEWVFHLACRNLYLSAVDVRQDFDTNLYGGFLLLQKAKSHCPNLKRFVYTSTASVYGNAPVIPTPESFHQITMPYSASKFSTEHYCQMFYHMYQLPVTTLRLSNVYGPGQLLSNPYCGVVTLFFDAVQNGRPIPIFGDGTQTRDFTFIDDAMEAILTASVHPDSIGKLYNVGTGKEVSIHELAETIGKIMGHENYPIEYKPKRVVDKVYRRAVDITFLEQDLHMKPAHSLEEGLHKTRQWMIQQKDA